MRIDVSELLARLRDYVNSESARDPMSTDALMGEHMIDLCASLIDHPHNLKHDVMVQQMLAWAGHRGLIDPEGGGHTEQEM